MSASANELREIWDRKPALRAVYDNFHREIALSCRPGRTLEIGSGSGNLSPVSPEMVATDIVWAPWLDVVADAQTLPFATASFDNIVVLEALHHIQFPRLFFAEAVRVLCSGGRIVLVEPAVTPGSFMFLRYCHHEDLDLSVDPFAEGVPQSGREPTAANQALPTLIFGRHRRRFEALFPELRVRRRRHMSFFAYPLSGGFRPWSLLPGASARWALKLERYLEPLIGPALGFHQLVVVERR